MILDVTLQAHLPSVTELCVHAAESLLPLRKGQVCTTCALALSMSLICMRTCSRKVQLRAFPPAPMCLNLYSASCFTARHSNLLGNL